MFARGKSFKPFLIVMFHTGADVFIRDRLYNNDAIIQVNSQCILAPFQGSVTLPDIFLKGGYVRISYGDFNAQAEKKFSIHLFS